MVPYCTYNYEAGELVETISGIYEFDPWYPLPPPLPSPNSPPSPPAPLARRYHLPSPLSTRPGPPYFTILTPWTPLLPLYPLVLPPVSSRSLSSPSCTLAQLLAAPDTPSTVSNISTPPSLLFQAPPVLTLLESRPLFLPQVQHRCLHFRMPPWPAPLRIIGRAWK